MAPGDKPSLSYEQPAPSSVPRWQFRLMFLLVLLNLAISIQMAYAPGTAAAVRKWWADYAEARRMNALLRQAANGSEPAGTVAWEEDPDAAAKLLASGKYKPIAVPYSVRNNYPYLSGWPRAAAAVPPAFVGSLQSNFPRYDDHGRIPQPSDDWAMLFMNGLKSAGGQERLVYVILEGKISQPDIMPALGEAAYADPYSAAAKRTLRLIAVPCRLPTGPTQPRPQPDDTRELHVAPGRVAQWRVPWRWVPPTSDKAGEVRLEPVNRFRFYAGQPDPADPSHFTIDYDLDGARGRIHGRLKDDGTVDMKPDGGTLIGRDWDPRGRYGAGGQGDSAGVPGKTQ